MRFFMLFASLSIAAHAVSLPQLANAPAHIPRAATPAAMAAAYSVPTSDLSAPADAVAQVHPLEHHESLHTARDEEGGEPTTGEVPESGQPSRGEGNSSGPGRMEELAGIVSRRNRALGGIEAENGVGVVRAAWPALLGEVAVAVMLL